MRTILAALIISILFFSSTAFAKTLVLEGSLASRIAMQQRISFNVDRELAHLSFTFALPASFANRAVTQKIDALTLSISPEPAQVLDKTDQFGNHFKQVTWKELRQDATVTLMFQPQLTSQLPAMESSAPFPVTGVPQNERRYLKSTPLVQGDHPDLSRAGQTVTASARNQYEAVSAILNFVADKVKYRYNPKSYDALYTLTTGEGNCQNFAHLSMALLRSVGIPARIVGGISLKEPWKVPLDKQSSLVQGMGQGGHAWMEIYFPDLGWLSYDPQQSRQFTSTRHIKQTHGLDSHDVNDSWTAAPYLPRYSESFEARFVDDRVSLQAKEALALPRPYLVSNAVKARASLDRALPRPAASPPPVAPPAEQAALPKVGQRVEFGNLEFPTSVYAFREDGARGERILDKETSAYATSHNVYGQAFMVEQPLALSKVSLAMHKFGGDGSLYLDLVADDRGKPSPPAPGAGFRSRPVPLESIARRPGYYWVDFPFAEEETTLPKGKYWIILRSSGDAIMNWFYLPGKPYSSAEDTRSTAKGYRWEDILNWDFVFKVKGRVRDHVNNGKGGEV